MSPPTPCDPEVFKDGLPICAISGTSTEVEAWVQIVAKESGQRVDWHYTGGVAQVLYVGDRVRVRLAVHRLRHLLRGKILKLFERDEPALYRAGDPLPEGVIGVVTTDIRGAS